ASSKLDEPIVKGKVRRDPRVAARALRVKLARFRREALKLEGYLVSEIVKDFTARNKRMRAKLRSLVETAALIEVEIYNFASQDVVWMNANPGFMSYVKDQQGRSIKLGGPAYDVKWESAELEKRKLGEREEIWDDEIGNMKANVIDLCTS